MGGPPPPPPPMGMGGPPPPPGMPGMGPSGPKKPAKKPIQPSVPMKQFFWTKISDAKVDGTIWDTSDDSLVLRELNREKFEQDFCKAPAKSAKAGGEPGEGGEDDGDAGAAAAGPGGRRKPRVTTLLDTQRSNNVAIMLSKMKDEVTDLPISNSQCKRFILDLDEKMISRDFLQALTTNAPKAEEIEILKAFTGPREELGKPEQFFLEILTIPRVSTRLECWNNSLKAWPALRDIQERLEMLEVCLKEIREGKDPSGNSKRSMIQSVLEVVLALGNYLNGGSFRGGAYGFKLQALEKLTDTKTASGKKTLMHFIADFLEKDLPDLKDWDECVKNADAGSRVVFSQLRQDSVEVYKIVAMVKTEIAATPENPGDKFKQKMTDFLLDFEKKVTEIKDRMEAIQKKYVEVAKFYGEEDVSTLPMDEFIKIFATFAASYNSAKSDNTKERMMREKNEKEEKRKRMQAEMKAQQARKRETQAAAGGGEDEEDEDATERAKRLMGGRARTRTGAAGMEKAQIAVTAMQPGTSVSLRRPTQTGEPSTSTRTAAPAAGSGAALGMMNRLRAGGGGPT